MITLLFDVKLKRPACALLQALARCNPSDLYNVGFDTHDWLVYPTADMQRISGTMEEWRRVVETHGVEAK